jgi:hypothetical protein
MNSEGLNAFPLTGLAVTSAIGLGLLYQHYAGGVAKTSREGGYSVLVGM